MDPTLPTHPAVDLSKMYRDEIFLNFAHFAEQVKGSRSLTCMLSLTQLCCIHSMEISVHFNVS